MKFSIEKNGCWRWNGGVDKDGYGKISIKKIHLRAHRLMAHLTINPYLSELDIVAHKCDNPSCINPEHLFITTAQGNAKDRDEKGRNARGEKCSLSILKELQVIDIRKRHSSGEKIRSIHESYKKLVTYGAIVAIVRRKTWRSIP